MRKQPTEEQKQRAAERREKFRALAKNVAAMSQEQRAAMVERVGAIPTCEARPLSVFNSCLVLSQNPEASMVGGFNQWIRSGRVVRKGEHGLAIWLPSVRGSEEEPEVNFVMGTVFDVSQTEELEASK